jgi:glucose-6-phosphate 1-dehydrogenase
MDSMQSELTAVNQVAGEEAEAYERFLTDALQGEASLFVREDAVEAAGRVVDPILTNGDPRNLRAGQWGPRVGGPPGAGHWRLA